MACTDDTNRFELPRGKTVNESNKKKLRLLRAVQAGEKSRWEIGDAALDLAPIGAPGVHNDAEQILRHYVEKELEPRYDISYEQIRQYRQVAAAWPAGTRVPAAWSVHRELMAPEDHELIRENLTFADAHRLRLEAQRERRRQAALEAVQRASAGEDIDPNLETPDTLPATFDNLLVALKPRPLGARELQYARTRVVITANGILDDLRDIQQALKTGIDENAPDSWHEEMAETLALAREMLETVERAFNGSVESIEMPEHDASAQLAKVG
jgi:hypothetical protein